MSEKYKPSAGEIKKAEEIMTDKQKDQSEYREKLHTDPETRRQLRDFIETVRNGGSVGSNFYHGPESIYGTRNEDPFTGYDTYADEEQMKGWEKTLSPEAFEVLKKWVESSEGESRIWYRGKTFQAPTTSGGRGSYYYWTKYPGAWMTYNEHEQYDRDKDETYYDISVSVAQEMTPEEKEDYLKDLENRYGVDLSKE